MIADNKNIQDVNMRKTVFVLLMLASAVLDAQAQKLGFVNGDDIVADDSTIVLPLTTDILGKMFNTGELAVKNYTTGNLSCTARMRLLENSAGGTAQICMGDGCRPISSWPFSFTFSLMASTPSLLLYEILRPGYGTVMTEFTVEGDGETHTVYIKFSNPDPTGIDNTAMSDGKCTVYDLQGNVVAGNVAANEIPTLKQGLYIVRSTGTRQVRKLLVR